MRSLQIIVLLLTALIAAAHDVPPEMKLEALPRTAPQPKENPSTPEKIALGRMLFFDPILSATKTVACATCHHPNFGWGDGRSVPIGVGGVGLGPSRKFEKASIPPLTRNAPTLLNVAFNGLVSGAKPDASYAPMFWDSRVMSLEAQALVPLRSREEMRGDVCSEADAVPGAIERVKQIVEYRELFAKAFPEAGEAVVTADHLAKAIASFERTLIAADSPFDRFIRGDQNALNPEQQRGMKIFTKAGCIHCHGGPMLSDYKLHVVGVKEASSSKRHEFRTPTLRNLRHTAPYMHNGSLRSLDDVLAFYEQLSDEASESLDGADASVQPPLDPLFKKLNLVQEDFAALKAFLDSLDDEHYDKSVPARVPSVLAVAGVQP